MALQRHLRIMDGGTEEAAVSATVKVAFATTDRVHVNQHFGSACSFVIYAINAERATLVEFAQFGEQAQDGHEDKLTAKLTLLDGCAAVYCQAVGGSAIRQLLGLGIQPLRVEENAVIDHLLETLLAEPPAWLAKAVRQQEMANADRFNAMEAEGWQE